MLAKNRLSDQVRALEERCEALEAALEQISEVAIDGHLPPPGFYAVPETDYWSAYDRTNKVSYWIYLRANIALAEGK